MPRVSLAVKALCVAIVTKNDLHPAQFAYSNSMPDRLYINAITDQISELVINQPQKRNALSAAMWQALPEILEKAAQNPNLRVLIIRGKGDHFSAGADISEFGELYATLESADMTSENMAAGFKALANFPVPTIAAIRGSCVGGGAGIALCADMRLADDTTKMAITPAKLGLVYPYTETQRLIEAVGIPNAKDLLFTARKVDANEAKSLGLIHENCKANELDELTMARANMITPLSGEAIKTMKSMIGSYQAGQRGDNEETIRQFYDAFGSDDFNEGRTAFLEKRKPSF